MGPPAASTCIGAGPLLRLGRGIGQQTYLNLGSGAHYIDGFVNIDGNVLAKRDLWLDIRHGLPYRSGTVNAIYMSHTLEHFDFRSGERILQEARRVLAPEGGIRIVVPSMEKAIAAYSRDDAAWFPTWPETYRSVGGRLNNYLLCKDQHRLMFDTSFLTEILEDAGFRRLEQHGYGSSSLFKPDVLGRMEPEDNRSYYEASLCMEAFCEND